MGLGLGFGFALGLGFASVEERHLEVLPRRVPLRGLRLVAAEQREHATHHLAHLRWVTVRVRANPDLTLTLTLSLTLT